ncbi:CheR family methyltransferase [Palleronia sp. KMU-117]|uniref:CheR family methyltransferase n=1 Tax=Palleronia sp. KMU-117 TaxID=3434108 RepID=UPI003D71EDE6
MTALPCPGGPLAAPLAPAHFARVAAIARREAGLQIPDVKAPMVQSRLARRLRALGVARIEDYLDFVEAADGQAERLELVAALTTNVTQFFRERHHFDTLRTSVLPGLVARARAGGRVRIWSAGCSTGQEAYSIAVELLRAAPDAGQLDLRVLATDIDRHVLDEARKGLYPRAAVASLPAADIATLGVPGPADAAIDIRPALRELVSFRALNLLDPWPMRCPFDAIFCRNVVIYFDTDTQRRLWPRFAAALTPGGWLFLGHSERVQDGAAPDLAGAGVTTYRRAGPLRNGGT